MARISLHLPAAGSGVIEVDGEQTALLDTFRAAGWEQVAATPPPAPPVGDDKEPPRTGGRFSPRTTSR
jgi:hypothetical protein